MPTNHENNRIPIGYSNPNRKRKKLRLTSCFKRERKTVGHSYFLQWQEKRQLKLQQTSKSNQRRRKTYEAHRAGLVPPCADTSTQNPKESNILTTVLLSKNYRTIWPNSRRSHYFKVVLSIKQKTVILYFTVMCHSPYKAS